MEDIKKFMEAVHLENVSFQYAGENRKNGIKNISMSVKEGGVCSVNRNQWMWKIHGSSCDKWTCALFLRRRNNRKN